MREDMKMRGIFKKKAWIFALALLVTVQMSTSAGAPVYGASDITGIKEAGDSVVKTREDGENLTFISPVEAVYAIELFGPKANGSNAGNGGYVSAQVHLQEGQKLDIYLGPGAPSSSGERNAAKGMSGNGFTDGGAYKSAITCDGTEMMVAGGGGAQGNPGTGNGSQVSITTVTIGSGLKCGTCGYQAPGTTAQPNTYSHYHVVRNGTGGAGGDGAHGGTSGVNAGSAGANGSSASGWSLSGVNATYYNAGGKGGSGGDGGACYVNPLHCTDAHIAGLSAGESKVVITMGEEILPTFDSRLLLEIKKEILEAIASMSGGGNTGGIPEITVVRAKAFDRMIPAYPDMQGGSSEGVTVENDDKTNKTIRVSGIFYTAGSREIEIDGNTFVFHVVTEPDSANVTVVFD